MAGVTLANVSKRFGDVSVIEDLSLEIRDEEFMVLVGPSGCGKSTALRMIAGLEEASTGTVSIGGRVVNDLPPKDRDIAMVFQSYALYPHMTVRENLEFGLRIRKLPRAEIDRLVLEAAGMLGLERLLDRKPRQLSGGQRQRVALGRALVRKPAVFLFDEPLSNLDAKLRVQMRAEITKLQQRLRTTSVYVTHDQTEAMTMGQRIAVMKDGKLQQVGTPLEVYERPANLFVARFIGTPPMNLFRATVAAGGGRLDGDGFSIPAPARLRPLLSERAGSALLAGLRPESLFGPTAAGRAGTAPLSGTVEILEPLGHEVVVHARVGAELLVARLGPREAPAAGASLALQADLDGVHLFDPETEARIGG